MEEDKVSYCRLCAVLKPTGELIDLKDKSPRSLVTRGKLDRLNIPALNLDSGNLPNTVCPCCLTSLDKAIEFIDGIETAQILLEDINIKKLLIKEENDFDFDLEHETADQIGIKLEFDACDATVKPKSEAEEIEEQVQENSPNNVQRSLTHPKSACNLTAHLLYHHTDGHPVKCTICNQGFKELSHLRDHIGTNEGKPFHCNKCGKWFRLEKQLNIHSAVHTEKLEQNACLYCKKVFKSNDIYKIHLRKHQEDKPYACDICKCLYTNWRNYSMHMRQKHNKNLWTKKNIPKGMLPINSRTRTEDLKNMVFVYDECGETGSWFVRGDSTKK